MAKVKDTLKRNIKFENVKFINDRLMDDNGDVIEQIGEKLPEGTTDFELQINVALPQTVINSDGEILSDDE